MKDLFTNIFNTNGWRGQESVSGPGSDSAQTRALIPLIESVISNFNISSIIDVPCGDWAWMSKVNLDGISYLGLDIVEPLIEKNNAEYGSGNISFDTFDICSETLPVADLVIVRDLLVHFDTESIKKALKNIMNSGSRYLLSTTYTNTYITYDLPTGSWFPMNLSSYLTSPIVVLNEGCTTSNGEGDTWWDKSLGLWDLSNTKTKFL